MKQQEKGRGKLDIRVLFTLAAIAEILGTLLIATLLTALLENLLHEAIEAHPLVWLLLFGTTIEAGCQREFRRPPDDEQRHQRNCGQL